MQNVQLNITMVLLILNPRQKRGSEYLQNPFGMLVCLFIYDHQEEVIQEETQETLGGIHR